VPQWITHAMLELLGQIPGQTKLRSAGSANSGEPQRSTTEGSVADDPRRRGSSRPPLNRQTGILRPRSGRPGVKQIKERYAPVHFAKEPLHSLEINPQSIHVQK
jgi:hypothetical protein